MRPKKTGRLSKREKLIARELAAVRVPVETIAARLGRETEQLKAWNVDEARAAAHAAANGLPPPETERQAASSSSSSSSSSSGSAPPPPPPAPPAAGVLTPEAVVALFEVVRSILLETACLAARVSSTDPRLARYVEFPQRHRELLTYCSPVLVSTFSKWLKDETAALAICAGVMIASTLPAALAITALGKELRAQRQAEERAKKEAAAAAANGATAHAAGAPAR